VVGKCTDRWAKANRNSVYAALPTPVSQAALLIKTKSQAFTQEKSFQGPRQSTR
jgi:hypothetical protein